jgi:hypothetical protein
VYSWARLEKRPARLQVAGKDTFVLNPFKGKVHNWSIRLGTSE